MVKQQAAPPKPKPVAQVPTQQAAPPQTSRRKEKQAARLAAGERPPFVLPAWLDCISFFFLLSFLFIFGFTVFYHFNRHYEHTYKTSQILKTDWDILTDTMNNIGTMSRVMTGPLHAFKIVPISPKRMDVYSDILMFGDVHSTFIKTRNEVIEGPASFLDRYSVVYRASNQYFSVTYEFAAFKLDLQGTIELKVTSKYLGNNNPFRVAFKLMSFLLKEYARESLTNVMYIVNYRLANPNLTAETPQETDNEPDEPVEEEFSL